MIPKCTSCGYQPRDGRGFADHMREVHAIIIDDVPQRAVDSDNLRVMGLTRVDFEKFLSMELQDWQWSVLRQLIGDPA